MPDSEKALDQGECTMRTIYVVSGLATAATAGYSAMDHTPVYPVPLEQAYTKLRATRFSDELGTVSMRKSAVTEVVQGDTSADGGRTLRWSLSLEGRPLGHISAELRQSGPASTRVAVTFHATRSGPLRNLAQFVQDDGLMHAGLQEMLDERVAASLEDRPFDARKVEAAISWYASTHPWEVTSLQAKLQTLQDDPAAAHDLFGDIAGAEAMSRRPDTRGAAAPMVSPKAIVREKQSEVEAKMRAASAPTTDLSAYR